MSYEDIRSSPQHSGGRGRSQKFKAILGYTECKASHGYQHGPPHPVQAGNQTHGIVYNGPSIKWVPPRAWCSEITNALTLSFINLGKSKECHKKFPSRVPQTLLLTRHYLQTNGPLAWSLPYKAHTVSRQMKRIKAADRLICYEKNNLANFQIFYASRISPASVFILLCLIWCLKS